MGTPKKVHLILGNPQTNEIAALSKWSGPGDGDEAQSEASKAVEHIWVAKVGRPSLKGIVVSIFLSIIPI